MISIRLPRVRMLVGLVLSAALITGCASFSKDGGFGSVAEIAQSRLGKDAEIVRNDKDENALNSRIESMLRQPLSVDDAVQISVLNNRSLQATFANLGIAEADLVQAGRLQNPSFDFKHSQGGTDVTIERTFTFNLIQLVAAPLTTRIEGRRFEQTKLMVANAVLKLALDTRSAYFEAVATGQEAEYARQVNASAAAGAELAARMAHAGNWSQLDLLREQAYYAEATASVGRAARSATTACEKLARLMGLWGKNLAFQLSDHLPDLPATPLEIHDAEQIAMRDRLDIQAQKLRVQETASSLDLGKMTRFINVLDVGYVSNSATGYPREQGYDIKVEVPLFDWGTSRLAGAEATYMQSVNLLAQTAINARSEARESYLSYRTSFDLATHYRDNVVPLRKKISDETLLRYNGMLVSVFELLADSREQAAAVNGYIGALKDFWLAETSLEAALGGHLPNPPETAHSSKGDRP